MSSLKRRYSKGSGWSPNQICLAIASGIIGLLTFIIFVAGIGGPQGFTGALAGAVCPGVFGLFPLALLWRSRRQGRRRHSLSGLIRSSSYSGQGFNDVTISSGQALPKICIRCGAATKRVSPFRFQGNLTNTSPYEWNRVNPFLMIFIVFKFSGHLILTKLWESIETRLKRRKALYDRVVFKIPHCKSCASGNPVVQRHFDFHGRNMILEAHPTFQEHLNHLHRTK